MTAPKTMQAWKVELGKTEPIRSTVPVPRPAPNGVLVKILAMGVCHSDNFILTLKEPIWPGMRRDFVFGHEGAGEVVEVGSEVKSLSVGDKVALCINPGCNRSDCGECSRGLQNLCRQPGSGNYGLGFDDGFFAEYVAVSALAAVKIPSGVDMSAACVAPDAVLTSYSAVRYSAGLRSGQTIVIYGLGGVGFNGLQTAIHLGAKRILVVDKRQATLDEAVKLGVAPEDTFCVDNPAAKKIEDVVAEKGIQVDVAVDFVGTAATIASAQMVVRSAGTVVVVGLLGQEAPFLTGAVVIRAVTIKGSFGGLRSGLEECLDLIAKGVLTPRVETKSVEDLPSILQDLDEGKIKSRMVLLPDWK